LQRNIDALRRHGQTLAAAVLARGKWVEKTFRSNRAKSFYRRNKKLLRPIDHAARLEALLWKGHVNSARRMLKSFKFEAGLRRLAEARLLLKSRRTRGKAGRSQVKRALAKVPAELRGEAGLVYDHVRWSRRNKREDAARAVLLAAPDPAGQGRRWWRERNIHIRDSLMEGDASGAYDLAAHHRQSSGLELMEAEWMAGWIALRFLGRSEKAFEHFTRLYMITSRPISRARGAYWLGRAADEWGKAAWAEQWFGEAAQYATTFYGQFALARLGHTRIELPRDPSPTKAEREAFEHMELVRAVRALQRLRLTELVRPFLIRLRNQGTTPQMWVMVAALGVELGQTSDTLRTGKWAARNGHVLVNAAYPIIRLAAQSQVELPLLLALIRQESEFEANAISPAGARGLMQLMPYTARRTAKSLRLRYARRRLTSDPGYNVKLGIAYMASLLDQYDGSYVLSLAAYNAGPNNVAAWMRKFGDPRKDGVDIVDWIESIPFGETRNYVQRILEGLQTYRAQFGDRRLAAAASSELWRPSLQIAAAETNALCVANALAHDVPPPC
jgi:soluble lytic murein transglycosylase